MGIEDFEEMRTMGYCYIDKTGLIRTLLENPGKVHLFMRPRIWIDEYDVPLDRAYHLGCYGEMVNLRRILFGQALKANGSLYFAVLTGCLRISKERSFFCLNNFNAYTVKDVQYNEYFGFSDIEIEEETGILIEIKYAEQVAFETGCSNALKQMKDRNYEEALRDDGMKTIYRYGIACDKKRCKVLSE